MLFLGGLRRSLLRDRLLLRCWRLVCGGLIIHLHVRLFKFAIRGFDKIFELLIRFFFFFLVNDMITL